MATWKTDLNVALAAMELLSGLAKVKVKPPNMLMCKRTVKWMCDLIVFQVSQANFFMLIKYFIPPFGQTIGCNMFVTFSVATLYFSDI